VGECDLLRPHSMEISLCSFELNREKSKELNPQADSKIIRYYTRRHPLTFWLIFFNFKLSFLFGESEPPLRTTKNDYLFCKVDRFANLLISSCGKFFAGPICVIRDVVCSMEYTVNGTERSNCPYEYEWQEYYLGWYASGDSPKYIDIYRVHD
jgi:hypothetical protein